MRRSALLLPCLVLVVACGDAQPAEPTLTSSAALAERMVAAFDDAVGAAEAFTVLIGGYEVRYTVADSGAAERLGVGIAPTDSASADPMVQALVQGYLPNVPLLAESLADAPLSGPFARDGHRVYVLDAGSAAGLDSTAAGGPSLRVFVDAATFQVREVYRAVRIDSLARPLTSRMLYDDFRTADGVTLPWRLRIVQEGLDQLESETARIVEGGRLALGRSQLASRPPSPERTAQLAAIDRRMRLLNEGIEEATAVVRRATVTRR